MDFFSGAIKMGWMCLDGSLSNDFDKDYVDRAYMLHLSPVS